MNACSTVYIILYNHDCMFIVYMYLCRVYYYYDCYSSTVYNHDCMQYSDYTIIMIVICICRVHCIIMIATVVEF